MIPMRRTLITTIRNRETRDDGGGDDEDKDRVETSTETNKYNYELCV